MAREKPVCRTCGSPNVVKDAWAGWDEDKQNWVLENHFDDAFCNTCEENTKLDWKGIPDPVAGDIYTYKGVEYLVMGVHETTKIQYEDEWHPTINYRLLENHAVDTFVRALPEFIKKFVKPVLAEEDT